MDIFDSMILPPHQEKDKYTCSFKPKEHPLGKPRKIVLDKFNIDKDRQEFKEKELYKAIAPMLEAFKEIHEVRIIITGKLELYRAY